MSIHKLTAGDGYAYLTRQVARMDATEAGHTGLGDYYSAKGESPGVWAGSGLADLGMSPGEPVTAEQMTALFGEGRHPNADRIEEAMLAPGAPRVSTRQVLAATRLGRPFLQFDDASDFRIEVARQVVAANLAASLPRDWPLGVAALAAIRSDVGRRMFTDQHGRPPTGPRELSSFVARSSRQSTTAVAGFDLTFSPVKSVSALWAIAPREVAEQIRDAHHAAVDDVLKWLEREAVFTRGGTRGVQQLDTTGMVAAAFDHRDSRAGDPDLHTHVAVSNKVRVRHLDGTGGRWLALDGRVLFKATVAASERYNTRLESELHARLGLRFTDRTHDVHGTPIPPGSRRVREVVGMPDRLLALWSSRRARIDARRADLAQQFQRDHGRPPTPVEAVKLAQQANLETRDAKHEPRSQAQQRAQWRADAARALGGARAVDRVTTGVLRRRPGPGDVVPAQELVQRTARVVAQHRATWQVWHVRAEAERQARAHAEPGADVDALVDHLVAAVLDPTTSVRLDRPDPVTVPDQLRRRDGASVYEVAGSGLFTSTAVLDAEAAILAAAGRDDGRAAAGQHVAAALDRAAQGGHTLNPAQAHLVTQMTTSGRRVQLAIAPAGSGKTTAMAALTDAWTAAGGTVLGLAPSAVAAHVLGQQTGTRSDTLAKLVWGIHHPGDMPDWGHAVDDRTLIVVDEAGMAGTSDLATVIGYAMDRGASVRLVGDDAQLASISAGGILRDLKTTVGAVTLTELHRFTDPAEAAATLALRAGDPAAVGYYLDNDRVHVGDLATVADHAYTAWSADTIAGRDTIMMAPTRALATELNLRARADRLTHTDHPTPAAQAAAQQVTLADGAPASAGDLVITRTNDRRLRSTATDWVKNGDRWTITKVHRGGAIDVANTRTGRHVRLPAQYVAASVQLGYATTVHGAQGVTVEVSHTIATGAETRQQAYVALTRGRHANHLYLQVAGDGEEHSIVRPETTHPPTAADLLEQILSRDEAQTSATTATAAATDPRLTLGQTHDRYRDSLHHAATDAQGPGWTDRLEAAADQLVDGLSDAPAWPTLHGHLALLAAAGSDPLQALHEALARHQIDTAHDAAAVLDWRLDPTHQRNPGHTGTGPLPWLAPVPAALRAHPVWGDYLTARCQHLTRTADQVRHDAAGWSAATAPRWARLLLDPHHARLLGDLAVYRAAHHIPDDDTRPTGPRQQAAADRRAQHRLDEQVAAAIDLTYRGAWTPIAQQVGLTPADDPGWPALVENLAALSRAGATPAALLRAAAAEKPLPDEHQADALWWRISRRVSPAVLTPDPTAGPGDRLLPHWLPQLAGALDDVEHPHRTAHLVRDPRWPAVVAAVARAQDHGVALADLLRHPLGPDGHPVPGHALADALIYRASVLTDPAPTDPDLQPEHPDTARPEDWHMVTTTLDENTPLNRPDAGDESDPTVWETPWLNGDPSDTIPEHHLTLSPAELDEQLWHAARARSWREPWQPTDEQQERLLARAADADLSPVTPERVADLNAAARDYYQATYPASWARSYLTGRLGIDLSGHPTVQPGYAPPGWTALVEHLRRHGATDDELLAAGLARTASTGRLIDTFRDRLMLPIHDTRGRVLGFVARRNPVADTLPDGHPDKTKAGPKYLNTTDTVLFAKGEQLYGATELSPHPDPAAALTPVLVEGPIDALAVTLAGTGQPGGYLGLACLGTALTDTHADQLTALAAPQTDTGDAEATPGPGRVVVATDPDRAGQVAAERAHWMLTARDTHPDHATLPHGCDPADLLANAGAAALAAALNRAGALADTLIDERLAHLSPQAALDQALQVIAAGPDRLWHTRTADLAARLHLPADVALTQLLTHIDGWDRHRPTAAANTLRHTPAQLRDRLAARDTLTPRQRWAPLVRQHQPDLITAPDWGALAQALDAADHAGYDIGHLLRNVLDQPRPLNPRRPGHDLAERIYTHATDIDLETGTTTTTRLAPSRPPTTPPTRRHTPNPPPPPSRGITF